MEGRSEGARVGGGGDWEIGGWGRGKDLRGERAESDRETRRGEGAATPRNCSQEDKYVNTRRQGAGVERLEGWRGAGGGSPKGEVKCGEEEDGEN